MDNENIENLDNAPNLKELSQPQNTTKKPNNFLRITRWIIITAIFLAIAIFFASTIGVNKLRSMRAQSQVTKFISSLYPTQAIVGKVCQGEDTDNDGYVSCAVTITARENPLSVQCPTILKSYLGTTCRLTPGVSPVNI